MNADHTETPPSAVQPARAMLTNARAREHERRRRQIHNTQHDQRFDSLRSLPARRALVIAGYLLLLSASIVGLWDLQDLSAFAAPLLYLLGFGVWLLLRRTLRYIDDASDDALDERQIALRNAAYRTSYIAVTGAALVAIVALIFYARFATGDVIEGRHLENLMLTLALGATLTPAAVLAWRQREV